MNPTETTKIEKLRQRLRQGPATTAQLLRVIGADSDPSFHGRVSGLLSKDIKKGKVKFEKNPREFGIYSIAIRQLFNCKLGA